MTNDVRFFVDSCIIFDYIFEEDMYRTNKFFNCLSREGYSCYVGKSVWDESNNKVSGTIDYIGNVMRTLVPSGLSHVFEESNRDPNDVIAYSDLLLFENLFIDIHQKGHLQNPMRHIEDFIVDYIEKLLDAGKRVVLLDILKELTKEIILFTNELQDKLDDFEYIENPKIEILYDEIEIRERDLTRKIKMSGGDAKHLLYMKSYSIKHGINTVFVTTDLRVLQHKINLSNIYDIVCSNPLYAIYNCPLYS